MGKPVSWGKWDTAAWCRGVSAALHVVGEAQWQPREEFTQLHLQDITAAATTLLPMMVEMTLT